ncbi:MAG: hypothetical protein ACI8P0_006755 [Planctomycetaceae bacterium]|jgi:hypothetical protein
MEVLEFETELVRKAYERHQSSIDETARFLKRFTETSDCSADCRRDPQFPRYSICTKIRVTPCSACFSPVGPAEVAFTQNISAGGASIILPETPKSDILRVDFANNVMPHTLILKLFWKLPAGRMTEGGGAFIGRL